MDSGLRQASRLRQPLVNETEAPKSARLNGLSRRPWPQQLIFKLAISFSVSSLSLQNRKYSTLILQK